MISGEKISVLIAVYKKDNASFLAMALDSIIQQTYPPDEILIMQDGPVPNELTRLILDYRAKYPELFTHIVNQKNLGLGHTLAIGITACRNELIARMDADDIACPKRLEQQQEEFCKNPKLELVGGYIEEFESDPARPFAKRLVPLDQQHIYKKIKTRNPFNHVTVMFKKSSVLTVGNYPGLRNIQDYYLWIKMVHAGCQMKNIPNTLVMVRTGNGMFDRRGGKNYIQLEKQIQQLLLDCKIINQFEYYRNLAIRIAVRKMGSPLRKFIYINFLRKGSRIF